MEMSCVVWSMCCKIENCNWINYVGQSKKIKKHNNNISFLKMRSVERNAISGVCNGFSNIISNDSTRNLRAFRANCPDQPLIDISWCVQRVQESLSHTSNPLSHQKHSCSKKLALSVDLHPIKKSWKVLNSQPSVQVAELLTTQVIKATLTWPTVCFDISTSVCIKMSLKRIQTHNLLSKTSEHRSVRYQLCCCSWKCGFHSG